MNAIRKIMIVDNDKVVRIRYLDSLAETYWVVERASQENGALQAMKTTATAPEAEHAANSFALFAKNIALFIASPFVGLAYVFAFPFIGLGIMVWLGARAFKNSQLLHKTAKFMKQVRMYIVAPFIGLAYIATFPFMVIGTLVWLSVNALIKRSHVRYAALT